MTKYLSCSSSFRSKRPRTEMLYSQKTEQEYPPNKKYSMVDLICIISYFKVCNDEHIRYAYIFNKKQLCAVFEDAESPGESFLTARNFKTFREIADQIWQDDRIINGLAKYEGRSYFMMQTIKKSLGYPNVCYRLRKQVISSCLQSHESKPVSITGLGSGFLLQTTKPIRNGSLYLSARFPKTARKLFCDQTSLFHACVWLLNCWTVTRCYSSQNNLNLSATTANSRSKFITCSCTSSEGTVLKCRLT